MDYRKLLDEFCKGKRIRTHIPYLLDFIKFLEEYESTQRPPLTQPVEKNYEQSAFPIEKE